VFFIKNKVDSKIILGLKELELDTQKDHRGEIWPIFSECDYLPTFKEDKISISKKNVLRGLHGDTNTDKLITCLHGKMQLAVADLRKDSLTYLNHITYTLSEDNPISILVPKGCINGHLCLSEKCIFYYKWSEKYSGANNQVTIKYDDEKLGIKWLIPNPTLSNRDLNGTESKGVFL